MIQSYIQAVNAKFITGKTDVVPLIRPLNLVL